MSTKIYGETGVSQVQDGIITDEKISSSNSNFLNNFNCMRFDNYLWVRDEKATGTAGGASVVGWQTRTLNTIKYNTISGASLANNQITLPTGIYYIRATAPSYQTVRSALAVYNATNTSYIFRGQCSYSYTTSTAVAVSLCNGTFSISTQSVIEIRHYIQTAVASNGLGVQTSDGLEEVYTEVEIWKIG